MSASPSLYLARKARGLCVRCPAKSKRPVCDRCMAKQLLAQRMDRIAWRRIGACTMCGEARAPGRLRCAYCLERQRKAKAESRARKQVAA
jgi:hypothetical protein